MALPSEEAYLFRDGMAAQYAPVWSWALDTLQSDYGYRRSGALRYFVYDSDDSVQTFRLDSASPMFFGHPQMSEATCAPGTTVALLTRN